uniref:Uncharacterized protein n=1 Tax=Oryza barthii TaxID=65489 RepID=A0A0D3GUD8_9ORYZ
MAHGKEGRNRAREGQAEIQRARLGWRGKRLILLGLRPVEASGRYTAVWGTSPVVSIESKIAANSGGQGKLAAPEKWLNCFVRVVALVERTGNAIGTLAFTWATVVLLGGYPSVLRPDEDFLYATTIIFVEAASYHT